MERDTESAHTMTYQLQDNMRLSHESSRDLSTPSMKEESRRLSRLPAQESMKPRKKEHMDSLLEKELKNEDLRIFLLLDSMSSNHTLLRDHSTLSTKREKRRLSPPLDLESMKSWRKEVTDTQLVRDSRKEDLKIYLHLANTKSSPELLKDLSTLLERRDRQRSNRLQDLVSMNSLRRKDKA